LTGYRNAEEVKFSDTDKLARRGLKEGSCRGVTLYILRCRNKQPLAWWSGDAAQFT